MDDLNGLDWSATPNNSNTAKPSYTSSASPFAYPGLQPTPNTSGRSTPLNQPLASKPPQIRSKPATPANDSFASLLGKSSATPSNSLSLQERQNQIQEQKAKEEAEQRKRFDQQFGGSKSQWNASAPRFGLATTGLQTSSTTQPISLIAPISAGRTQQSQTTLQRSQQDEDDLLAAFSAAAPVDASSHFPPPQSTPQPVALVGGRSTAQQGATKGSSDAYAFDDDDDDPFGLGQIAKPSASTAHVSPSQPVADDDDFLGMLGRPAEEIAQETARRKAAERPATPVELAASLDPRDKAVAELVDMGFPADKAVQALEQTESGTNVQAAVGILLNAAHSEAKQKVQTQRPEESSRDRQGRRPPPETARESAVPTWMQREQERDRSGSRGREDRQASGEKDVTQIASEIGSSLFKSANSLWKQGQKKVQKAVAEFQAGDVGGDPNQPKWMREAQSQTQDPAASRSGRNAGRQGVTDEAAMLDGGSRPRKAPTKERQFDAGFSDGPARDSSSGGDVLSERPSSRPREPVRTSTPASRASTRGYVFEEDNDDLLVASSRRRKATPVQQPTAPPSLPDSSRPVAQLQSKNPFATPASSSAHSVQAQRPASRPAVKSTPLPSRPRAPPRTIPHVDSSNLAQSARSRLAGTEAFKRGDYAAAHEAYNAALRPLPPTHPITIIILSNRALTAIKTGDPKQSISDADAALTLIGVAKGEGEQIAVVNETGATDSKEMKEFYGKAIMRKAEALEHLERWSEAAAVWREAVEGGVGGAVAIRARDRTEKAAGGGKPSSSSAAPSATATPRSSTPGTVTAASNRRRPAPPSTQARPPSAVPANAGANSAAVKALRAQHAAQNAEEDEKFALTDRVDAKLAAWKGTKKDNLRALLGSLDAVLWPEAGWTKVSMGDLVMPNRVKIVYMKAIARVHPDKISQTATTEQRMLAASVFATLNEAWDGFKRENNL